MKCLEHNTVYKWVHCFMHSRFLPQIILHVLILHANCPCLNTANNTYFLLYYTCPKISVAFVLAQLFVNCWTNADNIHLGLSQASRKSVFCHFVIILSFVTHTHKHTHTLTLHYTTHYTPHLLMPPTEIQQ